eukprot:CAMPEP_0198138570 /NCGR_PEP_ID=MMETSP1443-20131203/1956_1 /TAXON_ID=186043 /ORGANISM="Entomoneis sp., Strain CCMP2396" /LENGTH=484 /DNA_ID=CAMNT_0043800389 /DNA_START=124 /DNA_END=1578 /DNA_ORIENTATION=-
MSTEATEEAQEASIAAVKQILDTTLPKELHDKFNSLFDQAYELFDFDLESDEEEEVEEVEEDEEERAEKVLTKRHQLENILESRAAALCTRIEEEVSVHPIFAKTVQSSMLRWSLLTVVCEKTYQSTSCHDTIKFLIEANPHALFWRWDEYEPKDVIHSIAKSHGVLLPWIAERYPWVFEHKSCRKAPPHLELVRKYANGQCVASVVRRFYELYPQGLLQQDKLMRGGFPLQYSLKGWEECDADLFIWMAQQAPAAMAHKENSGTTVLHSACMSLSSSVDPDVIVPINLCTENMVRICRFLVSERPGLVRTKGRGGRGLPVHYLGRRCNRILVQEVLLLLLKEFPQSIEVKASGFLPKLSNVPFIQEVAPLVKQESEVQQEQEWLLPAAANFLACTRSLDFAKVGEVFESWVTQRTSVVLKSIQEQIGEIRLSFQGDDVDSSDDEEDGEEDEQAWLSEEDGSENEENNESEYSSDENEENNESE